MDARGKCAPLCASVCTTRVYYTDAVHVAFVSDVSRELGSRIQAYIFNVTVLARALLASPFACVQFLRNRAIEGQLSSPNAEWLVRENKRS